MTSPSWPSGSVLCPAPTEVNTAIRTLMEQPADARRAEEYTRLLTLWDVATRHYSNLTTAA